MPDSTRVLTNTYPDHQNSRADVPGRPALLQMIDRPQGVTVDDAARELRCTIRTISRDLGALQQAGFPVYTERAADVDRGVWRVTEDIKRTLPATFNTRSR